MIYNIDDSNYEGFISLNKGKTIVLNFYTNRCGFCKIEEIIFSSLHSQVNSEEIVLAKIDCDKANTLVEKFLIQTLPTIIIISKDENILKLQGISNEEKILSNIY